MKLRTQTTADRRRGAKTEGRRRSGMTMVYTSLVMSLVVGMAGLVIDGGRMMAERRHVQSAADAAAMAAAVAKRGGALDATAKSAATTYVTAADHNGLSGATVLTNIPPATGAFAGTANYVQVTVTYPMQTFFMHVLPGVSQNQTVTARAVAGFEAVPSDDVIVALARSDWPALDVSGKLTASGTIRVNSEGGGMDEEGNPSEMAQNGHTQWGAKAGLISQTNGIFAESVSVVGGVDTPENFKAIDQVNGGQPLECNQLPTSDPMMNLPTPSTANGVDGANVITAAITITASGNTGVPSSWINGSTGQVTMRPGVFASIEITGGLVTFSPGIYVIRGGKDPALSITGGTVSGEGVMFYNSASNYVPANGTPDRTAPYDPINEALPTADQSRFGSVVINSAARFTGINTTLHNYPGVNAAISSFNGVVFYQSRFNMKSVTITGSSSSDGLTGAIYAKWAPLTMIGEGTYTGQIFVRRLTVPSSSNITVNFSGTSTVTAREVFLVE